MAVSVEASLKGRLLGTDPEGLLTQRSGLGPRNLECLTRVSGVSEEMTPRPLVGNTVLRH